jgi:hypothetical protein
MESLLDQNNVFEKDPTNDYGQKTQHQASNHFHFKAQ